MNHNRYNGGLTREQFLFFEIRTTAALLCRGMSKEEALKEIGKQNLFQFPTERMIKSIAMTCFKRIEALESEALVSHLADAPADVARQINLYAIMCQNAIVWDFMTGVIGEKYRTQQFNFSRRDLYVFLMELQDKVPAVSGWSESTLNKIRQVLTRFLVECEYLESPKSETLNPVYLFPELEEGIRDKGDLQSLPAFNCFI